MYIKLKEYKEEIIYFNLFDILIKQIAPNRDIYLEDIDISPTTYKRCKNGLSKKGKEIINKLSNQLGYIIPDDNVIDNLEELFNKIYYDVYYKIETKYEEDINILDDLLKENYIIFPIIKLMKLFVIFNFPYDLNKIIKDNKKLFDDVKIFLNFYNNDLMDIYVLFEILTLTDVDVKLLAKEYNNKLCYSALASKLFRKQRYIECLFLSSKIKKQYIDDENFSRTFFNNLNIMACYNSLEEYKSAYDLALKQMKSLESLNLSNFHYNSAEFHYVVACLGLRMYEKIIQILKNKEEFTIKYIVILLVSYYMIDIKEYMNQYKLLQLNNLSETLQQLLVLINDILIFKKISKIDELSNPKFGISKAIINILKKMFCLEK